MPKWGDHQLRGIMKRGNKYWFRREHKPSDRERFGQRNFCVPLKTEDLAVAIVRAADAREQYERMVNPTTSFEEDIKKNIERLDAFAVEFVEYTGEGKSDEDGYALGEYAETLESMKGLDVAKRFYDIGSGKKTPISTVLDAYARERDATETNLRDKKWAIKRTGVKFLEDVPDKKTASAIASKLMLDPKDIQELCGGCRW